MFYAYPYGPDLEIFAQTHIVLVLVHFFNVFLMMYPLTMNDS
jgi:hypothetical protein